MIVDNIESAFQDQNFHQNFDWLLQQIKNPYEWPLLSAMVTIVLPKSTFFAPIPIAYLLVYGLLCIKNYLCTEQ